ncbi:hypothetical protein FRC17_008967 [Serendipita sp. 399]|nr:hypothetical protein FRC17_008967 [Serendipita sp. 399]
MRKVLLSRVDGVATECLEGDPNVLSKPPESLHAELMQELDTYPFVERQVLCVPIWREDDWIAHIERGIYNLIHDRPVDAPPTPPPAPAPAPALAPTAAQPALALPAPVEAPGNAPKKPELPKVVAPWRTGDTARFFAPDPEKIEAELSEDDMAIDDD